jgi:hypothetical protein
MRVEASATTINGPTMSRFASAVLALDAVTLPPPARPVTVRLTRFPVLVISPNQDAVIGHE